jgi:hypothetical protein
MTRDELAMIALSLGQVAALIAWGLWLNRDLWRDDGRTITAQACRVCRTRDERTLERAMAAGFVIAAACACLIAWELGFEAGRAARPP